MRRRFIGFVTVISLLIGLVGVANSKKVRNIECRGSKISIMVDTIPDENIEVIPVEEISEYSSRMGKDTDTEGKYGINTYTGDSIDSSPEDTGDDYSYGFYDPYEEFEELKRNPHLKDKEAALAFRLAFAANYRDDHDEARKYFRELSEKKYPFAELMSENYDKWFELQNIRLRYDSIGRDALSPAELETLAVYFKDWSDYDTVLNLMEESWSRGCTTVASSIGQLYYNLFPSGFLDEDNRLKALEWTEKGAQAGDPTALFNMGVFYEEGMIKPYDPQTAVKYYLQAAELNEPHALNNLSSMYYSGIGVGRDVSEGARLRKKAAESGHANSAVECAGIELGNGNFEKCRYYLALAIKGGRKDSYERIIDQILTQGENSPLKNNSQVVEFLKYLYDEGLTSNLLSKAYVDNVGTILDLLEADWNSIAKRAQNGDINAKKYMMWDSMYGLVSVRNRKEALKRFEELVKSDENYRLALSLAYLNENGSEHDFIKAKLNFRKFLDIMKNQNEECMSLSERYETIGDYVCHEWLGAEYDHEEVILNNCLLDEEIADQIATFDHLIDLESRQQQIIKKAGEGDAQSMYEMLELIDNKIYIPDEYRSFPITAYLIKIAQSGNTDACRALCRHYYDIGLPLAGEYWSCRAENVDNNLDSQNIK